MEKRLSKMALTNICCSLESFTPAELNILLKLLVSSSSGEFLLSREQVVRFLNIPDVWLSELTTSGELTSTEDGFFWVGAVYGYKQKRQKQTRKALKEMAELENSETTEIY